MSDAAPQPAPSSELLPTSPLSHSSRSARWLEPAGIGAAYLGFYLVARSVRSESVGAVLTTTVVSLGLIIWFAARLSRSIATPRAALWSALAAAAIILPLKVMFVLVTRGALHRALPPWTWLLSVPGLADLIFVWFAVSLGTLLSFIVRTANLIPPVAAVLALVDAWTVLLGGPVQKLMESENPTAQVVTQAMTIKLPSPSPVGTASPIPPAQVVGFADFLFIAFFVAAICRFVPAAHAYKRMVVALIVVLSGYMLIVFFFGWSLPALVPMSVVMIALHWRYFHYERNEAFALLYAALFILVIAVGFWYYGRKAMPPAEPPRADGRGMAGRSFQLAPDQIHHPAIFLA
jgi:hypothetical protein